MSIFSSIMDKIFHSGSAPTAAPAGGAEPASAAAPSAPGGSTAAGGPVVDVEQVLVQLADQKGGGGNWRTSIVDLLKLLDLDSSLEARKTLAGELGTRAGPDGSAEQNIALHKAVMSKLAENGGKVPDSLRQAG